MNKICMAVCLSAIMIICTIVPSISVGGETEDNMSYVRNAPVTIIESQDSSDIENVIANMTNDIEYSDDISSVIDENQIVIINGYSINNQNQASMNVTKLITQGNPVIIIDDSSQLFTDAKEQLRFAAFADDAQIYCMASTHNGNIICHSISGYTSNDQALSRAYEWASSIESVYTENATTTGIIHDDYFSYEKECGDQGIMSGITIVSQIEDNDNDANYYLVHFQHGGKPNSNHSKSGLDIKSNVGSHIDQAIYDHEPTNNINVTEVTFNSSISGNAGTDGYGISSSFGASWSHTYSDVTYDDQSTLGSGLFYVKYDIDECKGNGYNNLIVEPGMLIKVNTTDGAYHYNDTYYAEFCNTVWYGRWHNNFHTYSMTINGQINPI